MTEQPQALRLAKELDESWRDESCDYDRLAMAVTGAAEELRRLHAENLWLLCLLETLRVELKEAKYQAALERGLAAVIDIERLT